MIARKLLLAAAIFLMCSQLAEARHHCRLWQRRHACCRQMGPNERWVRQWARLVGTEVVITAPAAVSIPAPAGWEFRSPLAIMFSDGRKLPLGANSIACNPPTKNLEDAFTRLRDMIMHDALQPAVPLEEALKRLEQ